MQIKDRETSIIILEFIPKVKQYIKDTLQPGRVVTKVGNICEPTYHENNNNFNTMRSLFTKCIKKTSGGIVAIALRFLIS